MVIHNERRGRQAERKAMRARRQSTKVRREQLVQAALEVVGQRGVRKLSVAAVARRVGLVPSALYRHFGSKDELLDAIPELVRGKLLANVEAVRGETDDAVERLLRLLMRHAKMIGANLGIPRMVFSEEFFAQRSGRKAKMYATLKAYLDEVARMVREGQKQGTILRELDANAAAVMFLGMVQSAGIVWHVSDGEFDIRRHIAKAWEGYKRMLEK
jgi:AcrR family transcriptional regulator